MKIKNNFLLGKMNKDHDERLIKNGELIHAENIHVVKSEGSDAGAIENIMGNKKLTDIDFGTNPEAISGFVDEFEEKIYWHVVSDLGCFLVEWDDRYKNASIVLKDTRPAGENILNLSKDSLITGINLVVDSDNGNRLLLWAEPNNPPRCINIERAKTYGENNFGQDEISLIKKPPIFSPKITPTNDNFVDENNLRDKFLAFSYRYKYLDGEYSALSPFTSLTDAFLPKNFYFDYATGSNESMVNSYREVEIEFNTGSKLVTDVEVVFKQSGSNSVYFVESFNKLEEGWGNNENVTTAFANNKVTKILPEKELFRLYDNVPLSAKSQEIIGNRLVFGNYTENFNLIDSEGKRVNVDLKLTKDSKKIEVGTPTRSIKTNRDYEVGIAYLDEYGRMTTVLTSENNTLHVPVADCVNSNSFSLEINHKPPKFAKYYRIFMKQNKDQYNTVVSSSFYPDGPYVWLKMGPADVNKFVEGDYLVVKSDTNGVMNRYLETRVIEVKDQPRNFLEEEDVLELKQEAGMYFKLKPDGFNISEDGEGFENYQWEVFNSSYRDSVHNEANYIEKPSYYGSQGLDDLSSGGSYTKPDEDIRYIVKIDSTDGEADTFKWSDDDGATYTEGVTITGGAQNLSNGVQVTFGNTTGHFIGDNWIVSAKGRRAGGFGTDDGSSKAYLIIKSVPGDTIEGGAKITIIVEEYGEKNKYFEQVFTSSRRYDNLEEWFYGDGIEEEFEGKFHGYWFRRGITSQNDSRGQFYQNPEGDMCLIVRSSGTSNNFLDGEAKMKGYLTVLQSSINLLFETKEPEVTSDIFYELSRTYRISNGMHLGNGIGDFSQSIAGPAKIKLPFFNCFAWGNGFESYKIKDVFNERTMLIDTRPQGTIEDYRENHRIASLTYSGVYEQSTNYNALNEFNLSLANYKDLDDKYGSIQKIHSRDNNLLVLQEDKAVQVLYGKSVLYAADGSANVQQSTDVLGTTIPYAGEFGISKEPESFVSYGTWLSWTDSVRGKVMKLGGNGLFPISKLGMSSWFRDYFKRGGRFRNIANYDPHLDKMVLSVSPREELQLLRIKCGQELLKHNQTESYNYSVIIEEGAESLKITAHRGSGKITIGVMEYVLSDGAELTYSNLKGIDSVDITVTPDPGTSYYLSHECVMPEVVVEQPEDPEDTGTYYGYLAIACPDGVSVVQYPGIITSPEVLDESFSNKTVKIGDRAFTLGDVNDYSEIDIKGTLYLEKGNNTVKYPSCQEATE